MQRTDFNRGWTVQKDGSDRVYHVNLPHDAMLYEQRTPIAKAGSGGAFFDGGKYRYQKTFELNEKTVKRTMILELEGVYQNATVSLNGKELCEHPYGYTNFFVDISGLAVVGKNELVVIADNSKLPNTRWYSGSGIYREVHLYIGEREYIDPEGIKVTILGNEQVRVQTSGVFPTEYKVEIEIHDAEGKTVASAVGTDIVLTIPEAKHWDAEHPYLYTCKARLLCGDEQMETAETTFGLRTLAWGKDGLLVNGSPVLLRGACIHHDNGVLGACDFRDAEYRRIRILKQAGFNALRSAHNPLSKAMLDACDELGMYVMDEAFDMWLIHKNPYDYAGDTFHAWWQTDLKAMISKDYNRPSVIMYSVGNEISELGRQDGQETARAMVTFCHEQDATRPVTAGLNLALAQMASLSKKSKPFTTQEGEIKDDTAGAPTSEFFNKMMNYLGDRMDKAAATGGANKIAASMREIFDIPGYNYATSRYKRDGKEMPNQPTVGSETMTHKLYQNWQLVEQIPTLIGDFMWTGWDYLGEAGIGTIRYMDRKTKKDVEPGLVITSGAGVIDICGKIRPEAEWNRLIWSLREKPVIGVTPYTHAEHFQSKRMWRKKDTIASWSWAGCEGALGEVTVYSRAHSVELLCNDRSLGKRKVKENTAVFPRVPYQPGSLTAIDLDASGNPLGRTTLTSAVGDTLIKLSPDTTTLCADGQSLCFLQIDLVGQNGVTKSSADQQLTVQVTGAGTLQGFGSARPNMAESFVTDTHTTYYGKALAVIRAGYEVGTIQVTVSGKGLLPQNLQITVK